MVFARLAMVAIAVLAVATEARALETLGDGALSDATAQAGIDFYIDLNVTSSNLTYEDYDGLANGNTTDANATSIQKAYSPAGASSVFTSGTGYAGDMNIRGLGFFSSSIQPGAAYTNSSSNAAPADFSLAVGANNSGVPVLDIGLKVPQLNIVFDDIDVCQATAGTTGQVCPSGVPIVTAPSVKLVVQNFSFIMQLGDDPSGHLATLGNGSTPVNFMLGSAGATNKVVINDTNNANGGIGVGLVSATGLDLGDDSTPAKSTFFDVCSAAITVICGNSGMPGLLFSFGSGTMNDVNLFLQNVTFGDTGTTSPSPPIGSLALSNVNLGGSAIRIVGH